MAKNKFMLDFDGFLDYAEDLSNMGNDLLLKATKNALEASAEQANIEIGRAMQQSTYNFEAGQGYSQGDARQSLIKVSQMPMEVNGTVVTAYAGVDLSEAPEAIILAKEGTPHRAADKQLANALFIKGKVKTKIEAIQMNEFNKVLREGLNNNG